MITYAYTLSAAVVLCTIPIYIYTCRKSCSGSAWTRSVFLIVSAVQITLPANTTLIRCSSKPWILLKWGGLVIIPMCFYHIIFKGSGQSMTSRKTNTALLLNYCTES